MCRGAKIMPRSDYSLKIKTNQVDSGRFYEDYFEIEFCNIKIMLLIWKAIEFFVGGIYSC